MQAKLGFCTGQFNYLTPKLANFRFEGNTGTTRVYDLKEGRRESRKDWQN
jgi:hypothetical protein